MEKVVSEPRSVSIHEVILMFERWRQSRLHREAIPDELWEAALSLIPSHPATKVAQVLHLNYTKLRERMNGSSSDGGGKTGPSPWPFVELGFPARAAVVATGENSPRVVIEIEKPAGRFRCTVTGTVPENLLSWFRNLLDGR